MILLESFPILNPQEAAGRVAEKMDVPYHDRLALKNVLYELCLNVQHWAGAPGRVFIEKDDEHVVVTVQDGGLGVPATMREAFPDMSDEEAIAGALRRGVTSSGSKLRGFGLPSAVDLSLRGFDFYLESGHASVWARNGNLVFGYKGGLAATGTKIQIILPVS